MLRFINPILKRINPSLQCYYLDTRHSLFRLLIQLPDFLDSDSCSPPPVLFACWPLLLGLQDTVLLSNDLYLFTCQTEFWFWILACLSPFACWNKPTPILYSAFGNSLFKTPVFLIWLCPSFSRHTLWVHLNVGLHWVYCMVLTFTWIVFYNSKQAVGC